MGYITQKEVIQKYNLNYSIVYGWRKKGEVVFKKEGKNYLFDEDTLPINSKKGKKSKSQPTPQPEPVKEVEPEKKDDYIPGLDSDFILKGGFKSDFKPRTVIELDIFNKEFKTSYKTWEEASKHNLTEQQIDKYSGFLNWYSLLSEYRDREFTPKFMKKYRTQFMLLSLHLI